MRLRFLVLAVALAACVGSVAAGRAVAQGSPA